MTALHTAGSLRPERVSIDEIVRIKSRRPVSTSRERGWTGVTIDLYTPKADFYQTYPALDHTLICYCPSGSGRLVQRRDGSVHEGVMSAGMSLLMPAGCESAWEGATAASARLRIPTALLAAAGDQIGQRSTPQIEIRNVFETRDSVIEHLALLLLAEIDQAAHPAQILMVDQLSLALAAHMVRRYNVFDTASVPDLAALGHAELARLTEFIDGNLERAITLADLADLVNVSRFHFSRLFKHSTGMTPISYVERCRIQRARALILETDLPLVEIALMTGFADQSHFTRRFHRHVGCTPAVFARDNGRRRPARRVAG